LNLPPSRPLELIHRSGGDPARTEPLGSYVIESFIDIQEEGAATVYRVQIAPHQRTGISQHRVAEEYYYVLSGRATAILDGQPRPIGAGDFL
jgi:quercetin dioxygenase-like cupin family protein